MMRIIKQYLMIFACLAIAFFISYAVGENVFIGHTPKVRPNLAQFIAGRIKSTSVSMLARLGLYKPSGTGGTATVADIAKKLEDVPFTQISKGVYAKEDGTYSLRVIQADEIETLEYTFVVKGETIKIRVPKSANLTEQQLRASFAK